MFPKKTQIYLKQIFIVLLGLSLGSFSYLSSIDASEKNDVNEDSASLDILADDKVYSVSEVSGEIKLVEPSFYLQLRTEPFPEDLITIKRRPHALPGNTYGREYKERMNQERVGVVFYQCNIQEGVTGDCEAITELVSYPELMRKFRGRASRQATISLFSGILGGSTIIVFPFMGVVAGAVSAANLEGAGSTEYKRELIGDLLNQEVETYYLSHGDLVELRELLIKVTSNIVKNRR